MNLSKEENIRYARQLLLHNWGEETQKKLKGLVAFVAGAGGSGSPILTQLALLGFGTIRICDCDSVELSNLNRQFVHAVRDEDTIGMSKTVSAAKTVANINPHVSVEIVEQRIVESNVDDIVGDAHIIFDSVDHIPTKFLLSAAAVRKNIPHLFYGMMDINAFHISFIPPQTPCFYCLYDFNKVAAIELLENKFDSNKRVTPVCCPALFLSTGFAVNEALKILLDIGKPAYNKYFLFLQKNSGDIDKSSGLVGMKFWISKFFYQICLEQGYDWEQAWRGNIYEELEVKRNPDCSLCADSTYL